MVFRFSLLALMIIPNTLQWASASLSKDKKMVKLFRDAPKQSNICPECGKAQILKWASAGDGKNITLTSNHEECLEKYWKNIKEFDYKITIKEVA